MERMIATCGLICSECPAYVSTQNGDTTALEALAKTWSKVYGTTLLADDCTCNGCHSATGPWMSHCAECDIRACGTEKNVTSCAECSDYTCDKLTSFLEYVPDAKLVLDGLRGDA